MEDDKIEFVRENGNHMDGAESYWSCVRRRLHKFNGIPRDQFAVCMLEFEWRFNHPVTLADDLKNCSVYAVTVQVIMYKKKVIVHCIPTEEFNGIRSLVQIIDELLGHKYDFHYICFDFLKFSPLKKLLFRVLPVNLHQHFIHYKEFGLNKQDITRIRSGDLIHCWHPEYAVLPIKLQKNFVLCCNGTELLPIIVNSTGTHFIRTSISNAKLIHTHSHAIKKLLCSLYPEKKVMEKTRVVYPFIKTNEYFHRNFRNKQVKIGTLSRLVDGKNVLGIIEILRYLKVEKKLNFVYYLAGKGPQKNSILKKLDDYKIKYKYFSDLSDNQKKTVFYSNLDLFILVSASSEYYREGFGIVYLEANATGVPVIATRDGGTIEAIREGYNGYFVNIDNLEEIFQKILKLLKNQKKFITQSQNWAKKFDASKQIIHYEDLYKKFV